MKKKNICILLIIILLTLSTLIKIYKRDVSTNNEYNIYVVNATLPTLMISMDLIEEKTIPHFYIMQENQL